MERETRGTWDCPAPGPVQEPNRSPFAVCVVRSSCRQRGEGVNHRKNRAVTPSNSLAVLALFSSQVNPLPEQFHLPRLYPDLPDVAVFALALFISGFLVFTQVIVQAVTFQGDCLGTLCSAPRSSTFPLAPQLSQLLLAPPEGPCFAQSQQEQSWGWGASKD